MTGSRIDRARERAAGVKRAFAALAAVGLVIGLLLTRAGHPGHAGTAASATNSAAATSSSSQQTPRVIAPASGAAPQVQTSVS